MIDHKREEAVWKRVMEVSAQAPECCRVKERSELTAEQIKDLLAGEMEDICTYETLAGCVRSDIRRKLLHLAQQERCHCSKLETIYYLMTGKKACMDRPKRPCIVCLSEELRSRYVREVESGKKYHCLAEKAGSFARVFHELGIEEENHAYEILCILQQCL